MSSDAASALLSSIDPRTPVVVGVGQFLNRVDDGAPPLEPVALMAEAVRLAAADAGTGRAMTEAQVIAAVPTISWRYQDPAAIVRDLVGAPSARTWYATVGGNTPQSLLNRLAATIARGELDLAVMCGGEAVRSKNLARREGREVDWARQGTEVHPDWVDESPFFMGGPAEAARGIFMPLQAYPLFENALWHASGRTFEDHLRAVGEMWAGFSRVAESNPYAWRRESYTGPEITTPTAENRLIGFPYTKRMVANPDVDMASATVICSVERARALGIPTDRWVFLHAGTDGKDRAMAERASFAASPAIGIAGNLALELAGVGIDDVAHLDLYSCYPSAVQLALGELSIPWDRQHTVYGGLGFAGGPWNNPVGHAIASMVGVLREDPGTLGLVTANGGHVDKHAFGVYSTRPPAGGFRAERPQERIDEVPGVESVVDHLGSATIETWTVMHARDGSPERAHAACLTPDGARTFAVTDDPDVMARMEREDLVGVAVELGPEGVLREA
ncbi:MAG: acetyl-CoA acetyltransferase [Microthrixaceae bacterium]